MTAAVGSTFSYLRHLTRKNTLTNARRNIADHYDLVRSASLSRSEWSTLENLAYLTSDRRSGKSSRY